MASPHRVDLAHEPSFALGRLTVVPPHRELVRDDGVREVLEHRIMQVLIALAKSGGAIVTRDELTMSCWDGRVVGEDAINRVISRLRKTADGIGADSFRVETITKVGYRLTGNDGATANLSAGVPPAERRAPPTRRIVLAGAAAAGVAALAGGVTIYRNVMRSTGSPEVKALLAQAWQAWAQGTNEGNRQAIGLYRRAIDAAPDHADAQGFLAFAYGDRAHNWSSAAERPMLRQRARAAGRRALEIDPKSGLGRGGIAYAQPIMGRWLAIEREFMHALRDQPGQWLLTYSLALHLTRVGRLSEAAGLFARLRGEAPTATQYTFHVQALWGAGRLEEAERILQEAESIYALHYLIWFTRSDMLLYGGRPGAAIALAQDVDAQPAGVSHEDLRQTLAVARAKMSGDPAVADAVMVEQMKRAHERAWRAVYAMKYACALGRVDDAFAIADAYFFSRGFTIPDWTPTGGRPVEVTLDARETRFLFLPSVHAMRIDRRFNRLAEELGLERYWREAGVQPDFRRA